MFKRTPLRIGIRQVDLNNWTDYEIIGKAKEFETRVQAENPEFNLLWAEFEYLKYSRFIFETNEDQIKRFENILKIQRPKETLEERQKEVFTLWNLRTIWTDRTLRAWLDNYLGANKYKLFLHYNDYGLEIQVRTNNEILNNQELYKYLREIIPANLTIDIKILIGEKIIYSDQTKNYKTKFWKLNEVPSGRIPTESYKAFKNIDKVVINNKSKVADNRPYKTSEIKSNEAPRRNGGGQ